jgi:Acyl-CoA carboxylase epsilon subunit
VSDEQPLLRVVRGEPTAEELAALVAVVTARSATRAEETPHSAWTDRALLVRRCAAPGPGAWRTSGWRAQPFT